MVKIKNIIDNIPGDKSVTHRAVMFGSIGSGVSRFSTKVLGRDNFATIRIFQQLGVVIHLELNPVMLEMAKTEGVSNCNLNESGIDCHISIEGKGIAGLRPCLAELDCGNSGTTARLILGILSSCRFPSTLVGDHSLSKRPFKRVTEPLGQMGANFTSEKLPLTVNGGSLKGGLFKLEKASAQVKSAILLAGLFADGKTQVVEPVLSRDHTELMLEAMGVEFTRDQNSQGFLVALDGSKSRELKPINIEVPGDISASMFYVVAALLAKSGEVLIRGVGVNETRNRCLTMLIEYGAEIIFTNKRTIACEPVADLLVRSSKLRPLELDRVEVSKMVDEIPIISVLASFIDGTTRIRGAEELRVKESDRLSMTCAILKTYGVRFEEYEDGIDIYGESSSRLKKQEELVSHWQNTGDHRVEMSGAIMEYLVNGELGQFNQEVVETSFPQFVDGFEAF